jgi:HSP20 family protein
MLLHELNRGRSWDALREMERLQSRLNSLLAGTTNMPAATEYPPINIWTNQDSAVVTAEISDLTPDEIDISVVNQTLTLRGLRKPTEIGEGETFHRRERGYGQFTRTIELPFKVNVDTIDAKFAKGVLNITLPRAEEDKPRKIAVKSV